MPWYPDFEPASPRPVKDGLKSRSQRGSFSQTWWGRRWIQALEAFGWDTRLSRGRAYARRGQVVDLEVSPGQVTAHVQGSQPERYGVRIALSPLSDEQWDRAFAALAQEAGHTAALLAGELPPEIDPLFAAAGATLFPAAARDLQMDCSCPDFASPCKHVAAVHYLLAEEIDRDPFLLFTLRGKPRETVLEALRRARSASSDKGKDEGTNGGEDAPDSSSPPLVPSSFPPSTLHPPPTTLPLTAESFWTPREPLTDWRVAPAPPTLPGAVLRRLGPPDFADDPDALLHYLQRIYTRLTERALEASLHESPPTEQDAQSSKRP